MDENLRRQLLRTKRELQITINQIDNVLFYNPPLPPLPTTNNPVPPTTRSNASRQFVEGLMNILSSRRNSSSNESNPNLSRRTNLGVNPPTSSAPNLTNPLSSTSINSSSLPSLNNSLFSSSIPTGSIPVNSIQTGSIPTDSIPVNSINPIRNQLNSTNFNRQYISPNLFSNYTTNPINGSGLLPELVEVTLYSSQLPNTEEQMEDVVVSPNINVLSNSSSVHSIVRKINGCGHVFHINCIDTWFESNITCPICRVDLRDTLNATDDEMVDAEEG